MYEERFIAFVDILGFGKLVEQSEITPDLPRAILDALISMHPTRIQSELVTTVNVELIPPEELEDVKEYARIASAAQQEIHPVNINYFSDSLVISALADDVIASQMVMDLLTKISAMMWMSHKLLLRGGVTVGKLIHIEGGPMFGPAMNRAYYLESKLANHPRLLIDKHCVDQYRKVKTFRLFESFIQRDGDFYYASLATSFKHILNDSSLVMAGEKVLRKFRESMLTAPIELEKLREIYKKDERVGPKYEWLANEFAARIPEVEPAYPCGDDET
ncbi:hypothetical protein [Paraburkholderia terricola]|uniref:hypothetical protein n=1 Tax=Paraburkholderia terricola TaxID=169427 RepID=UPI001FD5B962|nr:hypothetical protein [Paraburkholderia terricola]